MFFRMISGLNLIFGGILIYFSLSEVNCLPCDKIPEGVRKQKNINDIDRYIILIHGNPKTYTPNQRYNVSLQVNPTSPTQKSFKRFMLTLESEKDSTTSNLYHPSGQFEFDYGSALLTKFSERCPNTVIENSKLPKSAIQVYWVAPPENSGCVYIKATVVESRDNWFSEDGQLTKKLCEDNTDEDFKPPILETCCSCDEAKYEVAFEGRWTRNTHPKNYPSDVWSTKFSDIIGISHRDGHTFWSESTLASDGLKEFAENGITNTLEAELKEMGENIRTIIKARGLAYPNITQSSYAVFRVDNRNHLVSLVSKIIPSPDWIVGVSNFELCQPDCTWAESYTYNLYPIDAGTDDGIDYLSSRPLQRHREITPITPNNPNDPRSPFYSEDGEPINPIAKLHFTRQRIYEKPCTTSPEDIDNSNAEDASPSDEADCEVEEWSEWSSCSTSCGIGIKTRERNLKYPRNEQVCVGTKLKDREECGEEAECEEETDSNCPGRRWGPWGPCNVTCGSGYRSRITLPQDDGNNDDDTNEREHICAKQETVECYVSCTEPLEEDSPIEKKTDCIVSWSPKSECDLGGKSCGQGITRRSRIILRHPENGGEPCPSERFREESCSIPCERDGEKIDETSFDTQEEIGIGDNPTECIMSKWSDWTPCSSICGTSSLRQRSRKILYKPPGVVSCPPRLDYKQCNLPIACTDEGLPIYL